MNNVNFIHAVASSLRKLSVSVVQIVFVLPIFFYGSFFPRSAFAVFPPQTLCGDQGKIVIAGDGYLADIDPRPESSATAAKPKNGPYSSKDTVGDDQGVDVNGGLERKVGPFRVYSGGSINASAHSAATSPSNPTKVQITYSPGGQPILIQILLGAGLPPISIPVSPPFPPAVLPGPLSGGGGAGGGGAGGAGGGAGGGGACVAALSSCTADAHCPGAQTCSPDGPPVGKCSCKGPTTGGGTGNGILAPTNAGPGNGFTGVIVGTAPGASGSATSSPGSAASQVSQVPARPGLVGDWFYSLSYPILLWRLHLPSVGEELLAYGSDGSRFTFSLQADGSFLLVSVEDHFGNKTSYFHNVQSGEVESIRAGGVETRYARSGSNFTIDVSFCDLSYQSCVLRPEFREIAQFDSAGRLLSYTGPETEFVSAPNQAIGLYDTTNVQTSRISRHFGYSAQGLLTQEWISRPTGENEQLYQVAWNQFGAQYRVASLTFPNGYQRTFSYNTPSLNQREVLVDDGVSLASYTYSTPVGHLIEFKEQPLTNLQAAPNIPYQVTKYSYLAASDQNCPLVNEIVYPNGAKWEGYFDNHYRLVIEGFTSPVDANQLVYRRYEYGHILDGSQPLRVTDEAGTVSEWHYSFGWHSNPNDSRGRLLRKLESAMLSTNQSRYKLDHMSWYADTGQIVREKSANGIVTEYGYEAPGVGSGRQLLRETASGPDAGNGRVDRGNSATTFLRLERSSPLGAITALESGPPTNPTRIEYLNDSQGRPTEVRSGSSLTKMFYDWRGNIASVQRWSRNFNGQPYAHNGSTGGDWYRTDYLWTTQSLRARLDEHRPPHAPLDWASLANFVITTFDYRPDGSLERVTNPTGESLMYEWNGYGSLWKVSLLGGPNLEEHFYDLDQVTQRKLARDNNGLEYADTVYHLNKLGQIHQITLPNSQTQIFGRDVLGRTVQGERVANGVLLEKSRLVLDELGRAREVYQINPRSGESIRLAAVEYGVMGAEQVSDQFGVTTRFLYDGAARVKTIYERGRAAHYSYLPHRDEINELGIEGTPGQIRYTQYAYYPDGKLRLASKVGLNRTAPPLTKEFRYNSFGLLEAVTLADGRTTERVVGPDGFTWEQKVGGVVSGRASRTIDPLNQSYLVNYEDARGRITSAQFGLAGMQRLTLPGVSPIQYQYDGALKLSSIESGRVRHELEYDQLGRLFRLSAELLQGGERRTRELFRDSYDRAYRVEDHGGGTTTSIDYNFGHFGEVIEERLFDPVFGLRKIAVDRNGPRGYDLSKIYSVQVDGKTWRREYDPTTGLITAIHLRTSPSLPFRNVLNFSYSGAIPDSIEHSNGLITTIDYDTYGALWGTQSFHAGALLEQVEYQRDPLQRIQEERKPWGAPSGYGSSYKYDPVFGNLVGEKRFASPLQFGQDFESIQTSSGQTFLYDPFDSELRTQVSINSASGGHSKNYQIDQARGRYAAYNGAPLNYDLEGNLTHDGSRSFSYDTFGNLSSVSDASGQLLGQFRYDPYGRLLTVDSGQGPQLQRWFGPRVFSTESAGGQWTANVFHPYVPNERLAETSSSGQETHTTWSQYSPLSTVDLSGILESYLFGSDGERQVYAGGANTPSSVSSLDQELGFHGMWSVPGTGLQYARARWYDSRGYFTQRDPLPPYRYNFASHDQINNSDPTGLQTEEYLNEYDASFSSIDSGERELLDVFGMPIRAFADGMKWIGAQWDDANAWLDEHFNNTSVGLEFRRECEGVRNSLDHAMAANNSGWVMPYMDHRQAIGMFLARETVADYADRGVTMGNTVVPLVTTFVPLKVPCPGLGASDDLLKAASQIGPIAPRSGAGRLGTAPFLGLGRAAEEAAEGTLAAASKGPISLSPRVCLTSPCSEATAILGPVNPRLPFVGETLYHYTAFPGIKEILKNGLLPGRASGRVFATLDGTLTPSQVVSRLALPTKAEPQFRWRINAARANCPSSNPGPTVVKADFGELGGGWEFSWSGPIDPAALEGVDVWDDVLGDWVELNLSFYR